MARATPSRFHAYPMLQPLLGSRHRMVLPGPAAVIPDKQAGARTRTGETAPLFGRLSRPSGSMSLFQAGARPGWPALTLAAASGIILRTQPRPHPPVHHPARSRPAVAWVL